jgi:hypothetical protein
MQGLLLGFINNKDDGPLIVLCGIVFYVGCSWG